MDFKWIKWVFQSRNSVSHCVIDYYVVVSKLVLVVFDGEK